MWTVPRDRGCSRQTRRETRFLPSGLQWRWSVFVGVWTWYYSRCTEETNLAFALAEIKLAWDTWVHQHPPPSKASTTLTERLDVRKSRI